MFFECSLLNNILTLFLGFIIIAYLSEDISNSFILKFSLSFIVQFSSKLFFSVCGFVCSIFILRIRGILQLSGNS